MKHRTELNFVCLLAILIVASFPAVFGQGKESAGATATQSGKLSLTPVVASNFAQLALRCITKEFPNKPDHVLNDQKDILSPSAMHPVFYGCFDWHSSVHGHWMLVHLLRNSPDLPEAAQMRAALDANFKAKNVEVEVRYLDQPGRKSFERTYGWAWLLKLAQELRTWDDNQGQQWAQNLEPLVQAIVARYLDFLPRQTYPIRTGVHPNTAFGIAFALDYARTVRDSKLEKLLVERSLTYFGADKDAPVSWEPGGEDFFSPTMIEADLMRRVLSPQDFRTWFERFAPSITRGTAKNMLEPAIVSDRSDPKLVHLDGLNLSRAWCMLGIASCFPMNDPLSARLIESSKRHAADALQHIASGNYEGEHWLASFAVYMLSQAQQAENR
jgi:hypothetical protein